MLSDEYWNTHYRHERYRKNLIDIFSLRNVSPETKAKIEEEIAPMMSVKHSPVLERLERILFAEIPEREKEKYLEEKARLMLNQRRGLFGFGVGPSMLPTLPTSCKCISQRITDDDWPQLEVNDLVSYVYRKADGNTTFATKRIMGFDGEIVAYKERKVKVPTGCVWVEGDNKTQSLDSRKIGAVPFQNLRNRHVISYNFYPPHFLWCGRMSDIPWVLRVLVGLER